MTRDLVFRQLNPHACRTYLLGVSGAPEIVLVDPVLDHLEDYLILLERDKLRLSMVIDTHTHADHLSAGASLKDHTGCDYAMHSSGKAACATLRMRDGDEWQLGDIVVRMMHTPGHTKDSLSVVLPNQVLTGDALFLDDGGAGRDDLPGGDPGEHWDSLQRLLTLPEHLVVHPGHEYRQRQPSSLAQQRKTNPHLIPRSREEFIRYVEDLKLGPADWMVEVLRANYACARDPRAAWIPADVPACEIKGTMGGSANDRETSLIEVGELKRRLDHKEQLLLLDVRDPSELRGPLGHLPGALNIPVQNLSRRLAELEAQPGKDIIVVCRSGGRAHTAAQILGQAGFPRVYVLKDGMGGWNAARYPVAEMT